MEFKISLIQFLEIRIWIQDIYIIQFSLVKTCDGDILTKLQISPKNLLVQIDIIDLDYAVLYGMWHDDVFRDLTSFNYYSHRVYAVIFMELKFTLLKLEHAKP